MDITVTIEGREVPFLDLFLALNCGDKYLMLPDGTFFPLDRPELHKLARLHRGGPRAQRAAAAAAGQPASDRTAE